MRTQLHTITGADSQVSAVSCLCLLSLSTDLLLSLLFTLLTVTGLVVPPEPELELTYGTK